MSKELKAPDKVTQKMTRDGAVAENLTTGETSSISERPQEENYSAPAGVAAEKVVQHIGAEIERHAAKGAEKKALDATQPKTHSSRLQFFEAERATPELQKAIKKSDKAADCLDAARAAIPKQTKIKKNADIFTLFGFKGIYLIKINDFRERVSANIHMIIKDSGYRSRRNMVSSGNRSKCLIKIFQILQNIMHSKNRYFLGFEDKRIEFIIGLSTT